MKKVLPFPNNKRREPQKREKREKRKKKHFSWTERLTGRSVRLCVSVRVRRLMRSPLVRYKLAIGERIQWHISLCFVGSAGQEGGRKKEDGGISGCRCVSFGLAVTSCFHTITNTAHPLTLHHHNQNKKKKEKKKRNVGGNSNKKIYCFCF